MICRALLDGAWRLNWHEVKPWFQPEALWQLGIEFAKTLWTAEEGYAAFNIGLLFEDGWVKRTKHKYEIGWCGQNASYANALLADYLKCSNADSLEKGLAVLDGWVKYSCLPGGLFRCHFPEDGEQTVIDACNLGTAALRYFEAYDLAQKSGHPRPEYFDTAIGVCNFALKVQQPSGLLGKAWGEDGTIIVAEGTIGACLVPPLVEAWLRTGEDIYLDGAKKAYAYYFNELQSSGYTTAGALDTYCIDKESSISLLRGALMLLDATGDNDYLSHAEDAAWYLSTWQWHHSVEYPKDTELNKLHYDTFGGTAVSTAHHHIDPYAISYVPDLLKLAEYSGNAMWRQRALAAWNNGTQGISDGSLVVMGKLRPVGSQDEGFMHTRWNDTFNVSQWLVAWPGAFRLEVLRSLDEALLYP